MKCFQLNDFPYIYWILTHYQKLKTKNTFFPSETSFSKNFCFNGCRMIKLGKKWYFLSPFDRYERLSIFTITLKNYGATNIFYVSVVAVWHLFRCLEILALGLISLYSHRNLSRIEYSTITQWWAILSHLMINDSHRIMQKMFALKNRPRIVIVVTMLSKLIA